MTMKMTGNGLDANNLIVKKRYRPHGDDGCIICGGKPATCYVFYCVRKTVEKVQMKSQYQKQVTRTYHLEQTVSGMLCADCIRFGGVTNILMGVVVAIVSVGVWLLTRRLGIGLLILPIIGLLFAVYGVVTGVRRCLRKTPTREDGEDTLREVLRARYPGYEKYMTQDEWDKQPNKS